MALNVFQERCVNRFFPGLIDAVRSLGAGEFQEWKPKYPRTLGVTKPLDAVFHLEYRLADGHAIEFRWFVTLKPGVTPYDISGITAIDWRDWEVQSYGLHYGKTFDDVLFRFDLDAFHGYHVHMPGPQNEVRVPADAVTLRTHDMSPTDFVEIVRQFRIDHINPLKRK